MKRFFVPTVIVASSLAILFVYYDTHRQIPIPPGPVAGAEPSINPVVGKAPWSYKGYTLLPMASCRLRARVLSTEPYHFDRGARLSPVDLAVGWRGMSDSTYLNRMRITQGSRWYYFHYDEPVLPDDVIMAQSKNIHVIPANPEIYRQVKTVRKDQVIRAEGWLVKATGVDGYSWVSSISTGGSGEGSCWLYWVERIAIEANPLVVRLHSPRINQ